MKALSGRQPWWWAILHAGKRIENRRWNTRYRGPILLHAAKGCTREELKAALCWMLDSGVMKYDAWPGLENVARGGIVGRARLIDVIPPMVGIPPAFRTYPREIDGRWHMPEQYGFVLADVQEIPFRPWPGSLGLFDVRLPETP